MISLDFLGPWAPGGSRKSRELLEGSQLLRDRSQGWGVLEYPNRSYEPDVEPWLIHTRGIPTDDHIVLYQFRNLAGAKLTGHSDVTLSTSSAVPESSLTKTSDRPVVSLEKMSTTFFCSACLSRFRFGFLCISHNFNKKSFDCETQGLPQSCLSFPGAPWSIPRTS